MRKGKINILDKKTLEDLVRNHISLSAILRELNLHTSSGNFRNLKKKLNLEKINFQHIMEGPGYDTKKIHSFKKIIPLDQILIEESTFNPTHLKKRLIRENLLKESDLHIKSQGDLISDLKEKNEVFVQQEGVYIYEVKSQP
jgi:hypothetical protein